MPLEWVKTFKQMHPHDLKRKRHRKKRCAFRFICRLMQDRRSTIRWISVAEDMRALPGSVWVWKLDMPSAKTSKINVIFGRGLWLTSRGLPCLLLRFEEDITSWIVMTHDSLGSLFMLKFVQWHVVPKSGFRLAVGPFRTSAIIGLCAWILKSIFSRNDESTTSRNLTVRIPVKAIIHLSN